MISLHAQPSSLHENRPNFMTRQQKFAWHDSRNFQCIVRLLRMSRVCLQALLLTQSKQLKQIIDEWRIFHDANEYPNQLEQSQMFCESRSQSGCFVQLGNSNNSLSLACWPWLIYFHSCASTKSFGVAVHTVVILVFNNKTEFIH